MSEEILAAFAAECVEILEGIEESVRGIEAGDEESLASLFRQVHTLKGSAGIVGMGRLEAFAHGWESRLSALRAGRSRCVDSDCFGAMMACRDNASRILGEGGATIGAPATASGEPSATQELNEIDESILTALDAALGMAEPSTSSAPPAPPRAADRRRMPDRRASLRTGAEVRVRAAEAYARIPSAKLESILSLASSLVVGLSNIEQSARNSGDRDLVDEVTAIRSTASSLYGHVLDTRMVPFGDVAGRFVRSVEEIARETGKKIRFALSGAETEIDKGLADRIAEPLIHLVRNAADHGIERPEARRAAGKPEEGLVALRARRESGLLSIRIEDDGAGIDPEAVRRRAIETGRIAPDARIAGDELFELLFEPGFSLKGEVTRWSGRGVGLDVVKRSVAALRGTVRLESRPGEGSAAVVRLPLSLSLVDGFVARVGNLALLVPFDAAISCTEFRDEGVASPYRNVGVRGELLPSIDLGLLYDEGVAKAAGRGAGWGSRVVIEVQDGMERTGLVVDSVGETLAAAVRPIDRRFADSPGIAGSAVLGDGSMMLILDAAELVRLAQRESRKT
ncbi:MAG: ATP-binding protein [Spirochaetaceae bacterium]|nr:ATP-binding protein [Spirochaetaceae bacterium]